MQKEDCIFQSSRSPYRYSLLSSTPRIFLPSVVPSMILLARTLSPLFMEALPLSLEEIFIYELGGEDYAVRDIIL